MRLPLLIAAALASGGWALSETRAPRHLRVSLPPRAAPLVEPLAEPAPPLVPVHPAPAVKRPPPKVVERVEPPPPPRVASISGRVVDDRGRPALLAKVHIDHGNTRMILDLDEQGRFSTVLPPGSYDVAVFDDDHDSVASGLDLKDGETVSNLRFELPAPAAADDDSGEGG